MARMRKGLISWPLALAAMAGGLIILSACGGSSNAPTATSPASASPTASTVSYQVALGTNNPVQGDCTTNTPETAAPVGSVTLLLSPNAFEAEVSLQKGAPSTTYSLFLQQVPGSCPQPEANGGSLTTNASGSGQASSTIQRVPGATTFFVQLVPTGSGPPEYTSGRLSVGS